ncbi:MAG: MBL fold metallo-hydrolase [Bacteroidia bacterium]|jgi:metallo-beta-lactamase family protein|nr:MBL fold metallo-hydrolase [Bacteroidia bacterium]
MKFTSWGAAQQVTGSKHLLVLPGGTRVLIDCGLDYEKRSEFELRNGTFPFNPADIDLLVLTHAHIDHSGNVPTLIKQGFNGTILCTKPTLELSEYLLRDSLNIQRMEAAAKERVRNKGKKKGIKVKKQADTATLLYSKKHIEDMLGMAQTISFNKLYKFNQELSVEFVLAGHILGAASAILHIQENGETIKMGFTGDLGNYGSKLVPDPTPMPDLKWLVSESTYGGRNHVADTDDACNELLKHVVDTCVTKGGKLVIPAFSVGRTQAIIFAFHQLYRDGKLPNIKIFTDSPLAIKSTTVYENHLQYLNEEARAFQQRHGSLFDFPNLYVLEEEKESNLLAMLPEPCVIISAAGMVEGGRIQMHVKNHIGNSDNTILIAGFCAEGTLGHRLLQGQDFVEINYRREPVRADIFRTDAFSAHPDHNGLLKFFKGSIGDKTKGVFLVHGDVVQMNLLAADMDFKPVYTPEKGQTFDLI